MKIKNFFKAILFATCLGVTACGGGSSADIYYVALGASDATGVGAIPITDGYVYQIQRRLNQSGRDTELLNLGIPSAAVDLIKDTELKVAILKDPDLVTLFTGGNDIVGGDDPIVFEQKLGEILQDLTDHTKAFVVVATLPDLTKLPRFIENPSANVTVARLTQFNAAIIKQAGVYHCAIADLRNIEVSQDFTAGDGYHPNGDGYNLVTNEFMKIIKPHFDAIQLN